MYFRFLNRVGFIFLFPFWLSCTGQLRDDPKSENYFVSAPKSPWHKEDYGSSADLTYRHKKTGSIIALNTVCHRYPDSSLSSLVKNLYSPISNRNITEEFSFQLNAREALWVRVKGTLDGVKVENVFVVMRKNDCLFDFALMSADPMKNEELESFKNFIQSFEYSGNFKNKGKGN